VTDHHLETRALSAGYGANIVLKDVNLLIASGKITAIVGANACGKSTLLKAMARLITPQSGEVVLDGRSIHGLPTRELARRLGLLPQSPIAPDGITVLDLVSRGRHPHHGLFASWSNRDEQAVAEALQATQIEELAHRPVDELSGGQRQRVWIAMALAQETEILLLDEPTTFLDISHQIDVLDLLTDLNRKRGTSIVMVLHDLNLAARYCDNLVAMLEGRPFQTGSPHSVLTEELVRHVFGLEAKIIADPTSGRPMMLPIGRYHTQQASSPPLRGKPPVRAVLRG
jgi:iron complex transport system ATP-binding protein